MRITYPRSFLALLLIGFSIVVLPLLFALASNALAFERLAGLSEQAVHSAVKVTQASRSLVGVITALERSARQYAVAGETPFLEAYGANRANFQSVTRQLYAMALSEPQRTEVTAMVSQEETIHDLIQASGPTPELSRRARGIDDVAIVRVEQLYPFPEAALAAAIAPYRNLEKVVWCQEEPQNQGAWYCSQHHMRAVLKRHNPKLYLEYAGRPPSASPAAGYTSLHAKEQAKLVDDAFSL